MPEVNQLEIDRIKEYYVYELFDRRHANQVFYVGEGVKDRALSHLKETERLRQKLLEDPTLEEMVDSEKISRILDIINAGKEHIGIRVIGRFDSKNEARAVETVLINWVYGIDNLTNKSRGRGAEYVRPKSQPVEELRGIDIERSIRVYGTGNINTGYLRNKIDNHEKFGHFSMAEDIVEHIKTSHRSLAVEDPCLWESGRYIGVFCTLVPNTVRMIIQLTDGASNRHVYNLKPMSESRKDVLKFSEYIRSNHPELTLKNGGRYAKLDQWEGLKVANTDLGEISRQIQYALDFFSHDAAHGASSPA